MGTTVAMGRTQFPWGVGRTHEAVGSSHRWYSSLGQGTRFFNGNEATEPTGSRHGVNLRVQVSPQIHSSFEWSKMQLSAVLLSACCVVHACGFLLSTAFSKDVPPKARARVSSGAIPSALQCVRHSPHFRDCEQVCSRDGTQQVTKFVQHWALTRSDDRSHDDGESRTARTTFFSLVEASNTSVGVSTGLMKMSEHGSWGEGGTHDDN